MIECWMLGRATNIPDIPQLKASRKSTNSASVKKKIVLMRRRTKDWYDKKTKTLPNLSIGQLVFVRIKPEEERISGRVIKQIKDRSYIVQSQCGNYRRNRCDILNRSSPSPDISNSSLTSSPLHYFSPPSTPNETELTNNSSPTSNHNQVNINNSFADSHTPRISRCGRILRKPTRLQDYL